MNRQAEVTKNPVRAKVMSLSLDGKTARVEVPRVVRDSMYGKTMRRVVSLHVDTASFAVVVGKEVNVLPCRRISKTKSWKVVSI